MQFLRSTVNSVIGRDTEGSVVDDSDEEEGTATLPPPPLKSVKPGFSLRSGEEGVEGSCGTWWNEVSTRFDLRVGPDYATNKKKEPAGPPLCELLGMDLVRCDTRIDNIGQYLDFPKEWVDGEGNDKTGSPRLFLVNVQIPTEGLGGGITSFFSDIDDGEGVSLVFYFRMKAEVGAASTPASGLFQRFCQGAPDSETDSCAAWKGRFKVIVSIKDIELYGLPSFIANYNGKPVLIRSTGKVYRGEDYVEQDINCHAFGSVARKALGVLANKFPSMKFNIGFIIESRSDDEMPECLLGCGSLNQPNKEVSAHWSMFSPM